MKRMILAVAVMALVVTSGQACWRPGAIRQAVQERRAARAGTCATVQSRPVVEAVRETVAAPVRVVGEVLSAAGNVVTGSASAIRGGTCAGGICR